MRSWTLKTALCLALIAAAPASKSNWLGTRWGMTKAQVAAAINHKLTRSKTATRKLFAALPSTRISTDVADADIEIFDGLTFLGQFGFDKGRLVALDLSSQSAMTCLYIVAKLEQYYGSEGIMPAQDPAVMRAWESAADGDRAHYVYDRASGWCAVTLLPLKR